MTIRLEPLTAEAARRVCTWVPAEQDVVLFAGPALPHPLTGEALLATREQGWHPHAVQQDGATVGTGSLRPLADGVVRLGRVLVDPRLRGRGLGRTTMELLLEQAFSQPSTTAVSLGVFAHNTGAAGLYRRLGFVETAERSTTRVGEEEWTSLQMLLTRPVA